MLSLDKHSGIDDCFVFSVFLKIKITLIIDVDLKFFVHLFCFVRQGFLCKGLAVLELAV